MVNLVEEHYKKNYKQLVNTYTGKLGGKAWEAEDVVAEGYSRALKYFNTFDSSIKPLDNWVGTIMYNAMVDHVNVDKPLVEESVDVLVSTDYDMDVLKHIVDLIHEQSDRNMEVLRLYYIYGYKAREIKQMVDLTHTNITTIVSRFRVKLKGLLGESYD